MADCSHVILTGQTLQARLLVKEVIDLVGAPTGLTLQVENNRGIDIAGAGSHDQALERGQAHGGIDRAASLNGGNGCAITQVKNDLTQGVIAQQGGDLFGNVLVRSSVSAVTTD